MQVNARPHVTKFAREYLAMWTYPKTYILVKSKNFIGAEKVAIADVVKHRPEKLN